ncbi:MAG: bifunctional isocitrate dehydrogenase kinase/phosphatase [Armatimonadetes bacterium]|nr:MAG: bifunctional isocitrate dehydrogenase kinase/phosphatase [Armatimonadota bacterium]
MSIDPAQITQIVDEGFRRYHRRHRAFTSRAFARFEARDWASIRKDSLERIDAYGISLDQTIDELTSAGFTLAMRAEWSEARDAFHDRYIDDPFVDIAETFFNSLARKMFTTEGIDPALEFLGDRERGERVPAVVTRKYDATTGSTRWIHEVARDCRFHVSWANLNRDVVAVIDRLPIVPVEVEVVHRLFFRGRAAYLVGSLTDGVETIPFAFAIRHGSRGIRIAAVLVGEADVSILFSYTRAAFHILTDAPGDLVAFLSELLPHRADAELWAAIGYRKQAKTERYRDLFRYLDSSTELFTPAPGVPGLVMIVFTLAGYDVVFKVVRDRFPPQKSVTPRQVAERYQLVARHDRAGRLVEAQRFHDLKLPADRFSSEVLEDLLSEASRTVTVSDGQVNFATIYVERRVTPLDLHIRSANPAEAKRAIIDYGAAIKNLAASNIFPGDMLLKNFGVTSRGRVVFYDYDELTELSECRFRKLPESTDPYDELSATPTFGIGPNDIFPEELPRFLGLTDELRVAFDDVHADLFEPGFWQGVQDRIKLGETIEILPYRRSRAIG